MALNIVKLNPEYFPDPAIGHPISNADIYVGEIDLDPEIPANQKQISIQQENGTIVPVTQPISTGAGGVPLYNGSPVSILVNGNYSLKVLNNSGSQIYYVPNVADFAAINEVDNMFELIGITSQQDGDRASMLGFFVVFPQSNFKGGGVFVWQANLNKNLANGGWIVDPDNIGGFDGTVSTRDAFLTAQGGGVDSGCWVREEDGPIDVRSFGATGLGVAVETDAINATVAYCKTLTIANMIVGEGTYLVDDTLTFDLPDYSTLIFDGIINSSVSGKSAIVIGSTSANTFGLTVRGIKVRRTAIDTTGASFGINLESLVWSTIDIRQCTGFQVGVYPNGVQSNGGFSHNVIYLGQLHDNRTNLLLTASGSGYCNDNNFYKGSFRHSSGYPAVTTINLKIDHFVSNKLNNNRFYGPSFEDQATTAVAAIINGNHNVIYWPRMERSISQSTYEIQFTVDSGECAIIGAGFIMQNSNINDSGVSNMYETREGQRISHQTPNTAGKGVLVLQSTATSAARLLLFEDTGGNETGSITGSAHALFKKLSLTNLGNFADDTAAAAGGVPVSGVYRNGSILQIRVT